MIIITKEEIAAADRELDRIAKATTPVQNRQIIDRIKRKPPMLIRTKPIAPVKAVPAPKPAPARKPVTAQQPQQPQEDHRPRWGSPVPLWGSGTRPASTPLPPSPELPTLPPKRVSTNLGSEGHQAAAVRAGIDLTKLLPGTDITKMTQREMKALASQQTVESVKGIAAQHSACYRTDPRKRIW